MPTTPTYPGVYIEEIPSGVRTITGVATSIAAFIGRALRGPTNEPITINSFGDFERTFGGLWVGSSLGFAVRDFYLNGGGQAVIVRLYHAETGTGAKPAQAKLTADSLGLEAASPGAWGNKLRARVDHNTRPALPGEAADSLFNLTVRDGETGAIESFRNVSITAGHPRQIDKVLLNESQLVRMTGNLPAARPAKSNDPAAGKDPWEDNTPATNYKVATAAEASDGAALTKADDFTPANAESNKKGLYALAKADLFNLLCIPPYLASGNVDTGLTSEAAAYCERRRAMLLVDPLVEWTSKDAAKSGVANIGTTSKNAALYFPRLRQPNALKDNQVEDFVPCGAVAGIFARTDAQRGCGRLQPVWRRRSSGFRVSACR